MGVKISGYEQRNTQNSLDIVSDAETLGTAMTVAKAPFDPNKPGALKAHLEAFDKAITDLMEGNPVDVFRIVEKQLQAVNQNAKSIPDSVNMTVMEELSAAVVVHKEMYPEMFQDSEDSINTVVSGDK
jgi:hypothetical protein